MRKCIICGKMDGNRSYFSVPRDERRKRLWAEIFGFELNSKSLVCGDHFLPSDVRVGAKTKNLMPSAVPSVGIVPQTTTHLMKQVVTKEPSVKNDLYPDDDDGLIYADDEHEVQSQTKNNPTKCDQSQSQINLSNHGLYSQKEKGLLLVNDFGGNALKSTTGNKVYVSKQTLAHTRPITVTPAIQGIFHTHATTTGEEFDSLTYTDWKTEISELNQEDKISIRRCCICGTKQHSGNLFKAPTGMELLWSKKCGMTICKDSRVCGKHFRLDDFRKNTKLRIIKTFAVPTLHLPNTYLTKSSEVVTMNFINEELYDETVHHTMDGVSSSSDSLNDRNTCKQVHNSVKDEDSYNYKSIAVQTGISTAQTCGVVQIKMNSNVYTLQCLYCDKEFPLWSWTKFVTHMKDNHQAIKQTNVNTDELYNDDTYIDKENYIFVIKSKDQAPKSSNKQQDCTMISNSSPKTVQCEETVALPQFDEVVPSVPPLDKEDLTVIEILNDYGKNISDDDNHDDGSASDSDGADASDDEENDSVFKKKHFETCQHSDFCSTDEEDFNLGPRENNLIRFGWTDRNIIVHFLDLLKTYSVLCHSRQDSPEEYDAALEAITKVLNNKWECGLTGIGVRISLNRITDWYRQVLIKMDKFKEKYKCKYPEYLKKCEDVLQKPVAAKCALCDNSFLNEVDLQVHQIMMHGKSKFPYKCSECDWLFADANTLQQHQNDYKEKEQIERFYCSMCNKGFHSRHLLKTHIKLHRVCEVCGKNFRNPVKYQRHRLLHDPPKFKCRLCPKIYHWQERLTEHMKLHRNQRDFICDECGRSFIRRATLSNHKYMLHRGGKATERLKVHECKICGHQSKSSNELHVHRVKRHLVLEGTIEELSVYRRKNYKRSNKQFKWIVDPEDPTKKRISCELCGNSYARLSGFYVHSLKMHNLEPPRKHRKRAQNNIKSAKVIEKVNDGDADDDVDQIDYVDRIDDAAKQIDHEISEYMDDNNMDQIDDDIIERIDDDIIERIDDDLVELFQ